MKCIIASNRPLPIRYYAKQQCFIRRGINCPTEVTLPFFVEVEIHSDYMFIMEYLNDITSQYKQCDLQIYSTETSILEELCEIYSVTLRQETSIRLEYSSE
ncbi:hypothetical protein [Solibacillus sp. CAU 1738]|uniref:hypothetical protein n=1 Tax=Solibacillus sp. CAU 1738 TaxID=3140363 RepID=UPI0032608441